MIGYSIEDIKGKQFGVWIVIGDEFIRDDRKRKSILCRCSKCGNESIIRVDELTVRKNTKTCQECRVTDLVAIHNGKLYPSNKTGYKGVCYSNHEKCYIAYICFNRVRYFLGNYHSLQDAVSARKRAEESLQKPTKEFYKKYHEKVNVDPEWAKVNPPKIDVIKIGGGADTKFRIEFTPKI